MSETRLSSNEIEEWLIEQTRSTLTPAQEKAKQFRDEMNTAIQSEIEISKMLLDNSTKEIERRNMRVYNRARALSKLAHLFLERLKKLTLPEQVAYENLNKFYQDTKKVFFVADIDVKNWFPRVSPFFIMDRRKFLTVHEKAKLTLASFGEFLTKEYVKTKTFEETFALIKELQTQERQKEEIESQLANMKEERIPLGQKITELEGQISELRSKGPIEQLINIETEAEAVNSELRHLLRHLQKPFLKIQALAYQGGGSGLTQNELKSLDEYLEKPLEALAKEEGGYPKLKETLSKVHRLIKEDKLKLKPDKARKAEQSIEEILRDDFLEEIHRESRNIVKQKEELLASGKMNAVLQDLTLFEEEMKQVQARKTSAETHEAVIERALAEAQTKTQNSKLAIENNVYNSLGKKIQVL